MPIPKVKRYAPLNPVGVHNGQGAIYPLNLLLGSFFRLSSETRQTLGSAMIVTCMSFSIQFLAGLLCLRALVFSKNALKSKLIKVMIVHTIALELANIVGFITAVIGLQWYLGPIQNLGYEPYEPASIGRRTPDLFIAAGSESRKEWLSEVIFWVSKVNVLNVISNVAFAVSGLLTDAMLIWRCRQIWKCTLFPRPNLIVLLPVLLLIASTAMSIVFCVFGLERSFSVATAYFSASLALNVSLTSLIVFRLLSCKLQAQKALGQGYGKHYTLISILFVESAFANAVCSIMLLASYIGMSVNIIMTFDVWIALTPAVQACANYLIIYRGSQGFYGSWSNEVTTPGPTSLVFDVTSTSRLEGNREEDDTTPDDSSSM
ncbi:hypothetical protein QCA50_016927 [Cerrena zonata]|uniref:Uncharacterized protein n=1 Tax=Cerrena zonata TaxID=2478898 RepID=A0AAW0FRL6_9APHY